MEVEIRKNGALHRYEAVSDGNVVGMAEFTVEGDVVVLPHTEVDPACRGHGVAARLIGTALDDIRSLGASVDPQCSYVAEFIRREPAYSDLVRSGTA